MVSSAPAGAGAIGNVAGHADQHRPHRGDHRLENGRQPGPTDADALPAGEKDQDQPQEHPAQAHQVNHKAGIDEKEFHRRG